MPIERMTEGELREHAAAITAGGMHCHSFQAESIIAKFCDRIGIEAVKPKPKVRPYTPTEFVIASNDFRRMLRVGGHAHKIVNAGVSCVEMDIPPCAGASNRFYRELAECWTWADDNSPCGTVDNAEGEG